MTVPERGPRPAPPGNAPVQPNASGAAEDDGVPVSVRLGTVVPPEDPEDWTRPLTWVAALGMLAAPLIALAWFTVARPATSDQPLAGTFLVAAVVVAGGVMTGATQIGPVRAFAGTLGAALFAGLATIIVGAAMAGERQLAAASPTLAQAFGATVAGLAGALVAATLMPTFARAATRLRRGLAPAAIGIMLSAVVVRLLLVG
jgi:hypothetical protein